MSETAPSLVQRAGRRMLEILDTAEKWTQGAFARDRYGNRVGVTCPTAVCFCFLGASDRARHDLDIRYGEWAEIDQALARAVNRRRPGTSVASFNDTSMYGDVLAVVRELAA